jgi:polyisoprenoid-binding protein YceI
MKQRFNVIIITFLALLALSACGVLQEPEEASGPIEAVPLAIEESAPNQTDAEQEAAVDLPAPGGGVIVYTIVPGESTVRFELEEDLRSARTGWSLGARITVVGTTDQVAGELALDLADLAATRIGEIRINARTLETDEFLRNRAIQNQIMLTEEYEFISFVPTSVNGLPDSAKVGDSVTFSIDGDMTIRDTTLLQTFAVTATLVSDTQIEGTASAVINREQYGLTIPNVANVTYVEEEVELYIDFIARAQ